MFIITAINGREVFTSDTSLGIMTSYKIPEHYDVRMLSQGMTFYSSVLFELMIGLRNEDNPIAKDIMNSSTDIFGNIITSFENINPDGSVMLNEREQYIVSISPYELFEEKIIDQEGGIQGCIFDVNLKRYRKHNPAYQCVLINSAQAQGKLMETILNTVASWRLQSCNQ